MIKPTEATKKAMDHRKMVHKGRTVFTCKLNSCQVFVTDNKNSKTGKTNFIATGYVGRSIKPSFSYRFGTIEQRKLHVSNFMTDYKNRAIEKSKTTGKSAERKLKVGSVLYSSWGYDQTNIDYYMITKLIGKISVMVVKIGKTSMVSEKYSMTGDCIPDKTNIIGEPMKKRDQDGTVKVGHHWAWLKEPKEVVEGIEIFSPNHWTAYA